MAEPVLSRPSPTRRTRAQRSAQTRARLLDATLECLLERGYARTTTALVEQRAGASRGARLHHFPTKAALVSAAVDRLYADIIRRYAEAMETMPPGSDRLRVGLRLLWESYRAPTHAAVLDLYVAARQEPELRDQLVELSRRHMQVVRRRANDYFPELARREVGGLLETLQAAFNGLAAQRLVLGDDVDDARVLDLIERMVKATFVEAQVEAKVEVKEEDDR